MAENLNAPVLLDPQATLKLCVDLINSERQAIWARNAAMLVGNSFIANSMKTDMGGGDALLGVAFSVAGMAICLIWAVITWRGWGTYHHLCVQARDITPEPGNPFTSTRHRIRRGHDVIFLCTMALIAVFCALYVLGLIHLISRGSQI